jgi:probable rRNA maturation factor
MESTTKKNGVVAPVTFYHIYKALPFPRKRLYRIARLIYEREKIPKNHAIHVILSSDYFIKKLNTQFRKKPYPTDVLSFNYDEHDFLGEIYISLQRAKIQAKRFHVSFSSEIERLFIHGMMHLLGFDHETAVDRKCMEAKEQAYVEFQDDQLKLGR